VAGGQPAGRHAAQQRHLGAAAVHRERAAGVKHAARRRARRVGRLARQDHPGAAVGAELGHGRAQRPGVRVGRSAEQLARRPALRHPAEVQHRGLLAQLAHDPEVVRDQQVGQAPLRPEPADQRQDGRLRPHVQRARRLVQHQQPRPHRQRPGDGDALALPAGQLVRVSGGELRVQPHLGQQRTGLLRGRPPAGHPVRDQHLLQGRADPHPRVQDPVGVLEDDLRGAPVVLQGLPAQPGNVLSSKTNGPADRPHQAQHRPAYGGLPGAALPDQPQATGPGWQPQADPVDGAHRAEPDGQFADVQQRGYRPGSARISCLARGPGLVPVVGRAGHGAASVLITGTAASRSAV